jgi:hypothetical protein
MQILLVSADQKLSLCCTMVKVKFGLQLIVFVVQILPKKLGVGQLTFQIRGANKERAKGKFSRKKDKFPGQSFIVV